MKKKDIGLALDNITKFGDTDIFPFPIENHIFFDKKKEMVNFIESIHNNFEDFQSKFPPININTCSPIGNTGFRWATLIDPIWNLYFLSTVISISDDIEKARIPIDKEQIFSYRFSPNLTDGSLFDKNINWQSFQKKSLEIVKNENFEYVIVCDIADFYNRIYHHRLENSLLQLGLKSDAPKRIMSILQKFSGTNSYGLPIGGPAARILAELSLNNIDRILKLNGIKFCRFVDDFHIFAKSREEAHSSLNTLSMKLMINEGLTLQKHKTQILTKSEFINLVASRLNLETEDGVSRSKVKFMTLPIRYDPYSPTAESDYKKIKKDLKEFDILDLLNEELRKTRIHQQFSKHLLKAFNVLDAKIVSSAFIAISNRIEFLYAIFPNIMIAAYSNFDKLSDEARNTLISKLHQLIKNDSYIIQVELNASYLARVLGKLYTPENEEIIGGLFNKFNSSILVKTTILKVLAKWKLQYWLSDLKNNFQTMSSWERRVYILGSYVMKDEGKHWREHNKSNFSEFELIVRDWCAEKSQIANWELPL